MTTELQTQPLRIPFSYAAQTLATLCDRVDAGEDLDALLVAEFKGAQLDLMDSVARRVSFFRFCESAIEAAKKARDAWADQWRRFETILMKVKTITVETMQEHPDLPYKAEAAELRLQKNPPSIEIGAPTKEMTFRYTVDDETVKTREIPETFLKTTTVTQLNIEAIREHINAGGELPFAKKVQGSHVRYK